MKNKYLWSMDSMVILELCYLETFAIEVAFGLSWTESVRDHYRHMWE